MKARVIARQESRPLSVLETENGLRVEVEALLDLDQVYDVEVRVAVIPC